MKIFECCYFFQTQLAAQQVLHLQNIAGQMLSKKEVLVKLGAKLYMSYVITLTSNISARL